MADSRIAEPLRITPTKKAGPRQPNRKSLQTRGRIMAAAAALCAQHGYGATKLADIAALAEIHLSALYYYFDTKEALFRALIGETAEQAHAAFVQAVAALPAETTAQARLEYAIRIHLANTLKPGSLGWAQFQIVQQAPAEIRRFTVAATQRENRIFKALLEDAAKSGAIRPELSLTMLRMILVGAMNWAIEWFREGAGSIDGFADAVIEVVFNGAAPR